MTAQDDAPARHAHLRQPAAPVLPAQLRRPAAVVVAVCVAGFVATALPHVGVEGPGPLDDRIDALVHQVLDQHRVALRRAVNIGSPRWLPVTVTAIVAGSLLLRRPRAAVAAVLGMSLLVLAVTVLQPAIGRTLDGAPALPSGHTAGAVGVSAAASLLLVGRTRHPRTAAAAAIALVLGVWSVVATGLLVNGLHVATDTIAGLCLAVALVYGSALLVDRVAERHAPA